jgi:hypothetical protein
LVTANHYIIQGICLHEIIEDLKAAENRIRAIRVHYCVILVDIKFVDVRAVRGGHQAQYLVGLSASGLRIEEAVGDGDVVDFSSFEDLRQAIPCACDCAVVPNDLVAHAFMRVVLAIFHPDKVHAEDLSRDIHFRILHQDVDAALSEGDIYH